MSVILAAKLAVEGTIRNATGIDNLNYYGHSLTIDDDPKGLIWPISVESVGKTTEISFKIAIGVVSSDPDSLQASLGQLTGQLLGGCFSSPDGQGFRAQTGGTCDRLEVELEDANGNTYTKSLSAISQLSGPIRVSELEGFVESARSSTLRGCKASLSFTVKVIVT